MFLYFTIFSFLSYLQLFIFFFISYTLEVFHHKLQMQRQSQNIFNFNDDIAQPLNDIKTPKSNKTKLIRDLNYKFFNTLKSQKYFKIISNSKEKQNLIKKQRSRKNSSTPRLDSLLQRLIPGAKITKGQWKDNKLNGDTIIQYENGNRFQGKYLNGLRVEGKMIYAQGNCQYEGSFFSQKFSGFGKLTYYGGRSIEGQWDNMNLIGNATIHYPNNDVYYGPVDGKLYKHGQGYLFFNNGFKYIGSFKNGSISGLGSYFKDQKLIKKGVWLKGKLTKQIIDDNVGELEFEQDSHSDKISTPQHNFQYKLDESSGKKDFSMAGSNKISVDNLMQQSSSVINLRVRQMELTTIKSDETQKFS